MPQIDEKIFDPALRSRFDLTLNFDLPERKARVEILRQYAKHLDDASLDIAIAAEAEGMSGRDLRDVCEIAERRHAAKIVRNEKEMEKCSEWMNISVHFIKDCTMRTMVEACHGKC